MNLTHRFSVPAGLDDTWAAFGRLEEVARCFPGATVTAVDGQDYTGHVKIKFGPIPLVYAGTASIIERNRDARRLVFRARGRDRRGNGTASATVTASFAARGDRTDVQVLTDLSITGRPAQFGGAVISDVSDRLLDLFVDCVSARLREGDLGADGVPARASADEVPAFPRIGASRSAAGGAGSADEPAPRRAAYDDTPARDGGAPDLRVLSTVVPVVLKRYWPAMIGAAVLAAVLVRLVRRRR